MLRAETGALGLLTFLLLRLTQGQGKLLLEEMVLMKPDTLVVGGSTTKALPSSNHPLNSDFSQATLGIMEVFETHLGRYLKVLQVIPLVFSSAPHHRRIIGMFTVVCIFY